MKTRWKVAIAGAVAAIGWLWHKNVVKKERIKATNLERTRQKAA